MRSSRSQRIWNNEFPQLRPARRESNYRYTPRGGTDLCRSKNYFWLLSDEFTPEGWKIVLLTRLIPLFPYKLSNYFFGLTQFRLWHFVLGTVVGFLPITMALVYAGTLAHDLATLGVDGVVRSPMVWALNAGGLVAAIVAIVYITKHANRALERYRPSI